jgi:TolB-like protein/Tfp pilus assembly protein PilF
VRDCTLFMALISANTNARSEGYFRREWNLAVQRMLDMADDRPFLLPVLIDDTPEPAARVPDRFRERQWTRLPQGVVPAEFAERVARLLGGQPALPVVTPVAAQPSAPVARAVREDEGFWIAVLPLKCRGADADAAALAEGLTEEVITGLSRYSYLRVIARSSTLRFTGEAQDARAAGKELGARYVIEGSLRQAGSRLRLAVQVVDAVSGAHLWAENFERSFSKDTAFDLQDDLAARIVSSVADMYGVLPHSMSEAVRRKDPDTLSPYEALLRSFGYRERMTAEEHAANRVTLERAVQQAPGHADALAMLALLYTDEHSLGFNPLPDPLGRALEAARRAVDAAPSNHRAHFALAVTLFHRKEFQAFRNAAERALALNPLDGSAAEYLGLCMAYAGDWDRGCALSERAMQLNPSHPGKLWYPICVNKYRQGDYLGALDIALRINTPDIHYLPMLMAAASGQLGNRDAAGKALQELLRLRPDYSAVARDDLGKWFAPELVEHLIDGLCKAGLDVAAADGADARAPEPSQASTPAEATARGDDGFWVAVLPIQYRGTDADIAALAEGLSEEIVTGLSRFSYLRVIARGATLKYAGASIDVRSAGRELGARYVMEGSLRQAGQRLRLAVRLVDATSGAHLWAENYERSFTADTVFEFQDELVPRIVSTVADMHGVLPHGMSEALRYRALDELSPYESVLRSFGYYERMSAEEHAITRATLESAVRKAPESADAWALLSMMYAEEYKQGFNAKPDPLDRALEAARRAVTAAPSNHLAYHALATALYFRRQIPEFRNAAERAVALNPMDGNALAFMGILLAYAGEWERGCALAERAVGLNPNFPGRYLFGAFFNAYRKGDYREALAVARKFNLPTYFYTHAATAAACGQLGDREAAGQALRELLALRPDFAASAREQYRKWFGEGELLERILDGLRKAGLDVAAADGADARAPEPSTASAPAEATARGDDGFWIAVLPFTHGGTDPGIAALADGLSEGIVTGMSRFSYLRVVARGATLRYGSTTTDTRSAGRELGARYVMEGSVRQAGRKVRIAVQLVDAGSGAHLWAESYDGAFDPDSVFELQDELVPRIVATVADTNGVLPHTMGEALRSRSPEQLTTYEAVLRSFGYFERLTAEDLASARAGLELAVRRTPTSADAWAMLALLCVQDYAQFFDLQKDSLARGLAAAQRAVEIAPSNHLAHFGLAQALFFHRDLQSFANAAERAVALNPMDGNSIAFLGELLNYAGRWERGLALAKRAKQLNPHHPGYYWLADYYDAYRRGDYRGALDAALKINMPGHHGSQAALAAAYGQLGEREAAGKALRELLRIRPDIASILRSHVERWWAPDYVEQFIDGVRKAGLEVPSADPPA